MSIVGCSLVRGLGKALNDDGCDVCCFTNPGGTIESTMPRIPDMTREDDDIIVLAVGSNDIPNDDVPTMIQKAGKWWTKFKWRDQMLISSSLTYRDDTMTLTPAIPTWTKCKEWMCSCNTDAGNIGGYTSLSTILTSWTTSLMDYISMKRVWANMPAISDPWWTKSFPIDRSLSGNWP